MTHWIQRHYANYYTVWRKSPRGMVHRMGVRKSREAAEKLLEELNKEQAA